MVKFIILTSFVIMTLGCERKQASQITMKNRENFILKCVDSARYDNKSVERCTMTAWSLYEDEN